VRLLRVLVVLDSTSTPRSRTVNHSPMVFLLSLERVQSAEDACIDDATVR